MMKKGESTAGPSASGGRPKHEHWYAYESIKINGKQSAKCLNCNKVFANTAKDRMAQHR